MNTIMWTTCISKIVWSAKQYIKNIWTKCTEIYGRFNTSLYLFLPELLQNETLTTRGTEKNEPINLMPAEPTKTLSKTLAEHLTLTFYKLFIG